MGFGSSIGGSIGEMGFATDDIFGIRSAGIVGFAQK